ncbi:MAG: hypothetical protein NVSMB57_14430 [Actinomycetota bacterium]
MLHEEGLDRIVVKRLGLECAEPDLTEWQALVRKINEADRSIRIAVVGKYVTLADSYLSVVEAIRHGAISHSARAEIQWVAADELSDPQRSAELLRDVDGILVPGGFGVRGIEGKVAAITYAREHKVPFLGLCLGLQCAVIEFARNVVGLDHANSSEFDSSTAHPVIDLMPDQKDVLNKGGTMRLGLWPCKLEPGTRAHAAYGESLVLERHRHRYEVNNQYRKQLSAAGMVFSGTTVDNRLIEMIELSDHPWFVASQFHPEFKSRPTRAHPLFRDFARACIDRAETRTPSFEVSNL